jgi:nitroreductase
MVDPFALTAFIKSRRSVRAYLPRSVSRKILEDIIDCARLAPTARNDQPWEFVVVTEKLMLEAIARFADHGRFIGDAPVCVAVFSKDTKYYIEDGSAATENIMLAARAHGLGSCWVAGDKKMYAEDIRKLLKVPDGFKLVSLVALGETASIPPIRKRPLKDLLHWESW